MTAIALAAPLAPSRGLRTGRRRAVLVGSIAALILLALGSVAMVLGDYTLSVGEVIDALRGHGEGHAELVVRDLRLPRVLAAILVGIALGFAGAIFQSLARNPLASPDVIGINWGASAAAVFIIVVIGGSQLMVAGGALLGALATSTALYLLAYRRGVAAQRLVLIGIGLGAMLASITNYLMTRANIYDAASATEWLTGSLHNRSWDQVVPLAIVVAVVSPIVIALTPALRTLQLGNDAARGVGVPVERAQATLVLVAVVLTAVATAAAGPIGFIAFVAPPITRRLVRTPLTMVPAALVAAVLLLASDIVAQRAFAPTVLPVGVVTGVVGAPYLLYLLARANKIGSSG